MPIQKAQSAISDHVDFATFTDVATPFRWVGG